MRAAKVPESPTDLATTIDFNRHLVVVKWQAPYNGGSPFTSFTVMIQHNDGVNYSQDLVSCPGDSATTLASNYCEIPFDTLISTPYNLPWGASVYAKVAGVNLVG